MSVIKLDDYRNNKQKDKKKSSTMQVIEDKKEAEHFLTNLMGSFNMEECLQDVNKANTIFDCHIIQNPEVILHMADTSYLLKSHNGDFIQFSNPVIKFPSILHDTFHGIIEITKTISNDTGSIVLPSLKLTMYNSFLFLTSVDFISYLYGKREHVLNLQKIDSDSFEYAEQTATSSGGSVIGRKSFIAEFLPTCTETEQIVFHSAVNYLLKAWADAYFPLA